MNNREIYLFGLANKSFVNSEWNGKQHETKFDLPRSICIRPQRLELMLLLGYLQANLAMIICAEGAEDHPGQRIRDNGRRLSYYSKLRPQTSSRSIYSQLMEFSLVLHWLASHSNCLGYRCVSIQCPAQHLFDCDAKKLTLHLPRRLLIIIG